ncbi:AzlC family ABC transporter permease [Sphaerochaeta globosa]|uniref:AzlC family protein n=1 Tax=Sphaerochaeta globosa (strain ATCC BAA-1886 / DSM 22777 / Buddy) TaxID=158189 RepID=F0RVG4_SPHGB|nr:AzlC family ABC transporter permease [Sphaerochaeta globosa]ADY12956.1 AzlC family protein [Sphaerochaeta globosa str. Buddy]
MQPELTFKQGCQEGFPIFVGYFPTAMAFGLVCRDLGLRIWEAVLFSLTNFAGSGQFLAANLMGKGAILAEIFISVMLVNLRYSFMGAELSRKLAKGIGGWQRVLLAHGTTDEVFSVAVLHAQPITKQYLAGLEGTAYLGWVSGTAVGFLVGMILPSALQLAVGVTLYAMFSSLLAQEFRQKGGRVLLIAGLSAVLNSILIIVCKFGVGWAFVISMLAASFIGAALTDEVQEYV